MVTVEAACGSDLKPRFKSNLCTVVPVTTVTKLTFRGFRHHVLESFTLTSHKYPPTSPPFAGVLYSIALQNLAATTGFTPIPSSSFEALHLLIDTNLWDVGCPIHPCGDEFSLNPTSSRAGNFAASLSITMGLRDW